MPTTPLILDGTLYTIIREPSTGLYYLWHVEWKCFYVERIWNSHEYFPLAFHTYEDAAREATEVYMDEAYIVPCA